MVRVSSKCPPGVFCMSPGVVVMGVIILLLGIGYLGLASQIQTLMQQPQVQPQQPQPPVNIRVNTEGGGDDRYTRAPKPERDWMARPDWSAVWNSPTATLPQIATRGIPESYQSMGIITTGDGQVLPLYGRRTASRSDRFQYYTRTDSYNPVQLPVQYKKRDCTDDIGCDELMDGEKIRVAATGKEGVTTIYRFSGPTYIPVV
jgi:hypothetical protein